VVESAPEPSPFSPVADPCSQCSREWPCDKCQGRKIPHLCRFVANKGEKGDAGFAKYVITVVSTSS
jgi:hypothetical protein